MSEAVLEPFEADPPRSWADQLHGLMVTIGRQYPTAPPERQRRLAGAAIAHMISAAADVGIFRDDAVPAQDAMLNILMMIGDLEAGRRHPWAMPVSVGGTNGETQVTREVRLWAIVGVTLLKNAGYPPVAAYDGIASCLTAAQYDVTGKGVKTWFTRHVRSPRERDQQRVEESLYRLSEEKVDSQALARSYLADAEEMISSIVGRFQS